MLIFLLQSLFSSLDKSPVYDEPPHIAAGLSYLATGVFRANPQHPPLLKEMSALVLRAAGIEWPRSALARAIVSGAPGPAMRDWTVGNDIILANGPDRVLFWARLPFIALALVGGGALYLWGRELVGPAAALGALFLYALDPTIVAHSFLVTTDTGLAVLSVVFLWTVWRFLQNPTWRRAAVGGLAMGAMLAAKFSAPFMVASAAVLLVAGLWGRSAPTIEPNSPCPCGSGKKYRKCHGAKARAGDKSLLAVSVGPLLAMCGVAIVAVEATYFFPSDPLSYLHGLQKVNADHLAGYLGFFHGALSKRFYGYFAAAYLLKEPLATLALLPVGLIALTRDRQMPRLSKLFLVIPPAVFFVAMTIFADDMGVRYLIPAMPFAFLIGGVGLGRLWQSGKAWQRYAAVGLCLWVLLAAAGIYPDHLSYFNEMACALERPGLIGWDGGSRCGPLWLDDSNVDWGQGLKQLRTWVERHPEVPALRLAYPDTFPPEAYVPRLEIYPANLLMPDPDPGWYAVSAALVRRAPAVGRSMNGAAWLERMEPVDLVGHAYYIYHVRPPA